MVLEDVLMMKYGKSISVEELFEPVLCALRLPMALKQALLLLIAANGGRWHIGRMVSILGRSS